MAGVVARLAGERYRRRVLWASAAYAVLLFGASWLFRRAPPSSPLVAYAAAIAPALPLIGVFVALGLYVREEADEYLRLLLVRQIVVATGLTLSLCTVWGFLESFGLAPRLDAYWAAIVWFAAFGAARLVRERL